MVAMDVDYTDVQPNTTALVKGLDELRYSRLTYTLGREALEALHSSKVLIFGCKGLGAEIAKNLALSGIGCVGLVDDGTVSVSDLGASFLLSEEDVDQNRAVCTAKSLKDLNPDAVVEAIPSFDIETRLRDYNLVVATYGTIPFLVHLNKACRSSGISFVATRARGVFGSVFTDFGDRFLVKDETGEPEPHIVIMGITHAFPSTVTVVDEQKHGLKDGDEVIFYGIGGVVELNELAPMPVTVAGSHSFIIPVDTTKFGRYTSGGYYQKVKPTRTVEFVSLEAALLAPDFGTDDPIKQQHDRDLHIAFQAVDAFERFRCPDSLTVDPEAIKDEDINEVLLLAQEAAAVLSTPIAKANQEEVVALESEVSGEEMITEGNDGLSGGQSSAEPDDNAVESTAHCEDIDENLVKLVALGAHVELCPIVAIVGGIASQEAIKAVTGVFTPLHQWLYIDAAECLPASIPCFQDRAASGSRYDAQVALFGRDLQEKLGHGHWLVVGAGSIGCEVMKNLVLTGIGCSPNGSITVTDMDHVSKPNLANQALYQLDDVGGLKTPVASRALRRINPSAQVRALHVRLDTDTQSIFDSAFFDSVTGVFSAVDTSSSRLYIDARCVAHRRPMIDGGKHGTKGSVHVYVPHLSETYASTRDPPEHRESLICTLNNFPYATEHTIEWAVERFEALFKKRPDDVNAYLSNRDYQESIRKSTTPGRLQTLELLRDALVRYRPLSFEACVEWARLQFEELFSNRIKQLCFNFPIDMKTIAGAPFWSGTKRSPRPLDFNPEDPVHMGFIVAAANLQAIVYGLKGCLDQSLFVQILQRMIVPEFQPKQGVKIAQNDSELRSMAQEKGGLDGEDDEANSSEILRQLPAPATLAGYRLSSIEFDKDDEQNFHAEFVAAAANLRAQNYGICPADKLRARLAGGKAIPSTVTAAAVAGGLMCLEAWKILQGKPLEDYRHSYFNLSVPVFTSAHPIKAVESKVIRQQNEPLVWTLWDKFEMDCVGMSLETFLFEFKQQQGLEVNMVMYGKSLLYAEFLNQKKLQERMSLTLLELVVTVGKVAVPPTENRLILSITCTDANDADVEVPDVIARIR